MASKTISEAQQELAQNCGYGDNIIWDLLSPNDENIMKEKIKQLIPLQEKMEDYILDIRNTMFKNIWKQRKYTNRASMTYIFYVMVAKGRNKSSALNSREFSCHPVVRCKKCDKNSDTSNCCMIYVDETGRIYRNWNSYITENVLPPGTMVAPHKGVYNFDSSGKVILDVYITPSGSPAAETMRDAQTSSAVLGIGSACVPIMALAVPVAAPIMALAGAVAMGVGVFTAITSAANLMDRKQHGQSISISDRQARASYVGVVGGSVGVAAAGATRLMTTMAAAGKATKGIEVLANGMNITSIVISGSGVANGVLDMIFKFKDGDEISTLDVLQLSASLVLFTHSVSNFQLASQIANDARVNSIKSYRETLSNRQRKMFDKMSKETLRIRGDTQGKMDIIRGVNDIPSRQYLNDLFKINKQLNQRNVRPAFGRSGNGIVLNNELPVETGALRQSVQYKTGPNTLDQVTRPLPSTNNSDIYTTRTTEAAKLLFTKGIDEQNRNTNFDTFIENAIIIKGNNLVVRGFTNLKNAGEKFKQNIADYAKLEDILVTMCENLSEDVVQYLMKLTEEFMTNYHNYIQQQLKMFLPTESILYRILKYITDNSIKLTVECISIKRSQILAATKEFFLTFNPNNSVSNRCVDCGGSFYITRL